MSTAAERRRAQRNDQRFRALCEELEQQDRAIHALQAEVDVPEADVVAADGELDAGTSHGSSETRAEPSEPSSGPDRLKGFVVRG